MEELLERWHLGLGTTLAERRIALRMAREQAAFAIEFDEPPTRAIEPPTQDLAGDDDEADFADLGTEASDEFDEAAFYAGALEDL